MKRQTIIIVAVVLLLALLLLKKPAAVAATPTSLTGAGGSPLNPVTKAATAGKSLLDSLGKLFGGGSGGGATFTPPRPTSGSNGSSSPSPSTSGAPTPDAHDAAGNPLYYDNATGAYYYGDGVPADPNDIQTVQLIPGFTPDTGSGDEFGFDSTNTVAGADPIEVTTADPLTPDGGDFNDWDF